MLLINFRILPAQKLKQLSYLLKDFKTIVDIFQKYWWHKT